MNDLKAMRTFIEVAKRGGFAAAARQLEMSTSSVSRLIVELEDWLGTSLLRRTTRSVTLTELGEQYLERCTAIVSAADDLRIDAQEHAHRPRGKLVIAVAAYPARKRVAPLLPEFLERFPDVEIELHLKDQPINLIDEGVDVAIRIGHLADSSMIARKCGEISLKLVASREFIDKHGAPTNLDELPSFPCLVDMTPAYGRRWPIGRQLNVKGPVRANDGEIIRQMTLAGLGLSLLPDFFVDKDIDAGRLESLFPDDIDQRIGIYAVFSSHKQMTVAAREFVDFLSEKLSHPDA
jgi:DNA-binding transcriptional LysR family regulator